jgi:hypothetical protein
MEELKQYLKDLITDVYDEHGQDELSEANDWDLCDEDKLIRSAGFVWGLEVALHKLNELTELDENTN